MPREVTLTLRKPLEDVIAQGHPWVWRDAVDPFHADPGDVATVRSRRGAFVARGVVDGGPIAARLWTTRDESLSDDLLRARVRDASALRRAVIPPDTDAFRLVHGEGDRAPGLVCDVYGDVAVLRPDGAGADRWRERFAEALAPTLEALGVRSLLLRRALEGSRQREVSALVGAVPEAVKPVREHGMTLLVDLARGQKTGLFLDQREARRRVRSLAAGRRVLNLFGYTGGFSVAAGLGGAVEVTTVDLAPRAVALADETWRANGLDPAAHRGVVSDVAAYLSDRARAGSRWDLVIADPPSYAPKETALDDALRAYRALHASAVAKVSPGGLYLAGSCSSHVRREAFLQTIREGFAKARRVAQAVDVFGAPGDHPVLLAFPEGEYLKNAVVRALA
ncbi:MAG: class I SAM-dependent rRNA methyltransferase [Polyangiales bacterium]